MVLHTVQGLGALRLCKPFRIMLQMRANHIALRMESMVYRAAPPQSHTCRARCQVRLGKCGGG